MNLRAISRHISALRGPILVTGASGFIGANLFKLLAGERDDVFAVVRHDKGWRLDDVRDERIVAADLNDAAATKHLVETFEPQTVFHCAAYGAYSFEQDPDLIYRTNFLSVVNLVTHLAQRPFAAFVHAGSSSEYGANCTAPPESSVCEPNSSYAVSKVAIANYLRYMGAHHAFPTINLRLYSVYGPLEDTSRLIPTLLRSALDGHYPPLVDARTSRDFVYVDDVCAAFVLAASRMQPDLHGENLNIGTGIKTTIAALAETTGALFDIDAAPEYDSMAGRSWDLPDWYADPRRAKELLGWEPEVSLSDGLRASADWVATLPESSAGSTTKQGQADRPRSIAAVVACYKDAEAIPIMHERLTATFKALGVDYEIIFVNDGSPDDSAEVIRRISDGDPHVLGITHSRNFGSQMAFRSGMELATRDSVVLLDGDLQDPPELITSFYEQYEAGFDVVYGRRVKREMPWHRGLLYKLFYRVFGRVSYVKIPLDAGDFSLMDRRVVDWLLTCPERDLFIRGLRAYVGFAQTGVDYVRPERMFGRTTNSFMKNIDWAKKAIFSFSNTPLTMVTNLGIFSLIASVIGALVVTLLRIFVPNNAPRGITTVIIIVLILGSLNLFAVGLVGEYVSKIMVEVKRRPRLIRAQLIRNGESTALLPEGRVGWQEPVRAPAMPSRVDRTSTAVSAPVERRDHVRQA